MGRKSLAEERRKQILDAFAVCIRKYGLEASSLELIAKEAGVKRSIIRHYIGNRDEVLKALVKRITQKYYQEFVAAVENVPKQDFVSKLLNYLFAENGIEKTEDDKTLDALLATGEQETLLRQLLLDMYKKLENTLVTELSKVYPNASRERVQSIAYSVMCLSLGNISFLWLGISKVYNAAAREYAGMLLRTLEAG